MTKKSGIGLGTKVNVGLNVAFAGPEAISAGKRFAKQQRRITGTMPPGTVPDMKKTSAHQALRHFLNKRAGFPENVRGVLPWAIIAGAGTALGGLAVGGGARGVGNTYQKFRAGRMFKELEQREPEIRRNKESREYFDLAVAYAPSLLKHPRAIGDFLKRQLQYPMSSIEFIKQLADLEATVTKTEKDSPSSRFGEQAAGYTSGYLGTMTPKAYGGN